MKMQFKQLKNILTRPLNYGGIREYSIRKPYAVHARSNDGEVRSFNVTSILVFPQGARTGNDFSEIKMMGGEYQCSFVGRKGKDEDLVHLTVDVYKRVDISKEII
jgi:hypothetical protein